MKHEALDRLVFRQAEPVVEAARTVPPIDVGDDPATLGALEDPLCLAVSANGAVLACGTSQGLVHRYSVKPPSRSKSG